MFPATIIIPLLYQKDSWLHQCVLSALQQTTKCKVIVVCSPKTTSGNLRILESFRRQAPRFLTYLYGRSDGFAGGINDGIALAESKRTGFLLSDDWLEPMAAEKCMQRSADIVSTQRTMYCADGITEIHVRKRSFHQFALLDSNISRSEYLGHFLFFNTSALREVGGVDPSVGLTGADDFDLIWTLLDYGATVSIVEESCYNYRDHPLERLTLRNKEDQLSDLEKILEKHDVHADDRPCIRARHAEWYGRRQSDVLGAGEIG